MWHTELKTVYCENHTEQRNACYGHNAQFLRITAREIMCIHTHTYTHSHRQTRKTCKWSKRVAECIPRDNTLYVC